jgi:hypothetical protein
MITIITTQVLSDENLRRNYDLGGRDGVADAPKMDAGIYDTI